eukprot:8247066-Pyramimonas_sp.AAC.1
MSPPQQSVQEDSCTVIGLPAAWHDGAVRYDGHGVSPLGLDRTRRQIRQAAEVQLHRRKLKLDRLGNHLGQVHMIVKLINICQEITLLVEADACPSL